MEATTLIGSPIMRTIESELKAVMVLAGNDLQIHALAAIYSSIDKMAWLCTPGDKAGGAAFQDWCSNYFIAGDDLPYRPIDLWAARCGMLHTGAAESDLYRSGYAKLIYYTVRDEQKREEVLEAIGWYLEAEGIAHEQVALVVYQSFLIRYGDALNRFTDALKLDQALCDVVQKNAGKQLAFYVKK